MKSSHSMRISFFLNYLSEYIHRNMKDLPFLRRLKMTLSLVSGVGKSNDPQDPRPRSLLTKSGYLFYKIIHITYYKRYTLSSSSKCSHLTQRYKMFYRSSNRNTDLYSIFNSNIRHDERYVCFFVVQHRVKQYLLYVLLPVCCIFCDPGVSCQRILFIAFTFSALLDYKDIPQLLVPTIKYAALLV